MAQELELPRRLASGTWAVPIALGGMLGTGIFVGIGPAFAAAGWWSLLGVPIAALTAVCAAVASSYQSTAYRGPGPAYTCTRARVGVAPARMAASAFFAGHLAAMAAIAGVIGDLLFPRASTGAAAVTILLVVLAATTGLRIRGVASWLWLALTATVLGVVVAACFAIDPVPPAEMPMPGADSAVGITGAAGVLVFAFLGFERLTAPADERDRFQWRAEPRQPIASIP